MISPTELVASVNASYAQSDAELTNAHMPRPGRVYAPKRYTVTFATLAPGGTQTQIINISANGDFFLTKMQYKVTNAGAAQTGATLIVPQWRIQITDSGSDELFANASTDLDNIATNAAFANKDTDEPYTRVISGRSTLTLTATSYEAANTYSLDFCLTGALIKTWGGNV